MLDFNEKAVIGRIKQLRLNYAGSRGKSKFARKLGINPSTYNYYEENRVPPIDIILKISELTGANIYWLLTGSSGEHRQYRSAPKLMETLENVLGENPEMAEPLAAFVELLCEKKGVESRLFDSDQSQIEKGSRKNEARSASSVRRPGWIPVLGRTAAGIVHFWDETLGNDSADKATELSDLVERNIGKSITASTEGQVSLDLAGKSFLSGKRNSQANLVQIAGEDIEGVNEFIESEQLNEQFPDSFALRVDGNSMYPLINDGDIIVVSPSLPAGQGQICLAKLKDQIGVTCKLIRVAEDKVHLIPINENYEPKVFPKEKLVWALAVICHIKL